MQIHHDDNTGRKSLPSKVGEHGKAQQNFEQNDFSSRDYTINRLGMFRTDMNVGVLQAFSGHSMTCNEDYEVKMLGDGSIVW